MRRGTRLTTTLLTTALVVSMGAGAAFGVLHLTDLAELGGSDEGTVRTAEPPAASPVDPPTVRPTPTIEPAPEPEPLLERGDRGVRVRALQHRFSQIAWYFPPMTGTFDKPTVEAVRGFQDKRGFEVTGEVDPRTWKRLLTMTRQPTDDEMFNRAGPPLFEAGNVGLEVRKIQARMRQISWYFGDVSDTYGDQTVAAVKGFQAKRMIPVTGKVDQRTLDLLVQMTSEPTAAELANKPPEPVKGAPLDPRCLTGRALCVDKSSNSLRWVVDGRVLTTVDVRFGSDELPTREGQFAVRYKSRDHVSSLYNTSMPFAMFFSGGQAVHYSPDFAANGFNGASHGCVNVRDYGAIASLYEQVRIGDKVVVYWS